MSDLVEKVAKAMWNTAVSSQWEKEMAGKAIAAVAEWLDPNARPEIYGHDNTASEIVAAALLKQLEQPK